MNLWLNDSRISHSIFEVKNMDSTIDFEINLK